MREILVYDDYEIHKLGAGGGTQYEEVTTEKATRIDVTDVAKGKGKLLPFGRTYQKQLSGKNLFDKNTMSTRYNRFMPNQTVWTISSADDAYSIAIPCLPNKTYTLSHKNTNATFFRIGYITENPIPTSTGIEVHNGYRGEKIFERTIQTGENATFIIFQANMAEMPNTLETLQLEEGDTATDYEEYCGGQPSPNPDYPQPIENVEGNIDIKVCNKNLINPNKILNYGIVPNEHNAQRYNGRNAYLIPAKANTIYTFSRTSVGTASYSYLAIFDEFIIGKNNSYTNAKNISNELVNTVTTTENTKYIMFFSGTGISENVQIEESTTATPYVKNNQQIIPFPLQDGQKLMEGDYLADDGVHHVRGQHILNGTENWLRQGSTHINILNLYTAVGSSWNVKKSSQNIYCTIAKKGSAGQNNDSIPNVINFNGIYNNLLLDLSLTDFTSVDDFISFLQTYNIIVEYELAEETIDTYTPEQQEAYNKLMNLKLYKGVNHIWTNTDGLEPNLQLAYKRKKQSNVLQVSNVQPLNNLELNNTEETPEEITTEISEE